MPIYEYQCDECGLRFEVFHKSIPETDEAAPCEDCGKAARKLVTAASHTFKHSEGQTRGPLPPNTGTSDDWNYDKAIGRDAAEKWEVIGDRGALKDQVIREEAKAGRGITRDHLIPTGASPEEGNPYQTVTESERQSINRNRNLAVEARKHLTTPPGE